MLDTVDVCQKDHWVKVTYLVLTPTHSPSAFFENSTETSSILLIRLPFSLVTWQKKLPELPKVLHISSFPPLPKLRLRVIPPLITRQTPLFFLCGLGLFNLAEFCTEEEELPALWARAPQSP